MKKFTVKPKIFQGNRYFIGSLTGAPKENYIYMGRSAEIGPLVNIFLDISNPHVVAIFGKRGTGKSYTLGTLMEGMCTSEKITSISHINKDTAILLFDTLGIFQWSDIILSQDSDKKIIQEQIRFQRNWEIKNESLEIEIWSPKGMDISVRKYKEFKFNTFDLDSLDWGYLLDVDIYQDRIGQLIGDVYEKVVNEGWFDYSNKKYLPKRWYSLDDLINCAKYDKEINDYYHVETRRAVIQQLACIKRNPIFHSNIEINEISKKLNVSNTDESIENHLKIKEKAMLADFLKPGKLSILLLHKLSNELRYVIIMSLIRKIMKLRMETSEKEKNLKILNFTKEEAEKLEQDIRNGVPPIWIVVDEAQNFLPSERKTRATDELVRLVREGRNFGLSFMFTTQQPSAIDQRILSQVDIMIIHKLTVQNDIEYIKKNLKSSFPEEIKYGNDILNFDELLKRLDVGQSVISDTESPRAFVVDIRPRVSVHGGFSI